MVDSERVVSKDVEAMREFMRFFGWQKGVHVLGQCMALALLGETADTIADAPEYTTRWRLRRDLKRFAEHLRAMGRADLLEEGEPSAEWVVRLVNQQAA